MLHYVTGNLFEAPVEALVNTVNCVGVMGKGIALQFKQAFPESFRLYRDACARGEVVPGRMLVYDRGSLVTSGPRYVVHFPTKRHWKGRSQLADIRSGLDALVEEVAMRKINSIALPPLGTGNGGLDWENVRPLIETAFATLSDVHVHVYMPGAGPDVHELPVNTERPRLTRARASLVRLIKAYSVYDYPLSAIEVQKLAYFGAVAGLLPRLKYVKHHFGPYSEPLNHVLRDLNGHLIEGLGDRATVRTELRLLPGAAEEAEEALALDDAQEEVTVWLDAIRQLIEGFETPYGMELLATVHWLVAHDPSLVSDLEATIRQVHAWNGRKRRLMKPEHVEAAWAQLQALAWTPLPRALDSQG